MGMKNTERAFSKENLFYKTFPVHFYLVILILCIF